MLGLGLAEGHVIKIKPFSVFLNFNEETFSVCIGSTLHWSHGQWYARYIIIAQQQSVDYYTTSSVFTVLWTHKRVTAMSHAIIRVFRFPSLDCYNFGRKMQKKLIRSPLKFLTSDFGNRESFLRVTEARLLVESILQLAINGGNDYCLWCS